MKDSPHLSLTQMSDSFLSNCLTERNAVKNIRLLATYTGVLSTKFVTLPFRERSARADLLAKFRSAVADFFRLRNALEEQRPQNGLGSLRPTGRYRDPLSLGAGARLEMIPLPKPGSVWTLLDRREFTVVRIGDLRR